MRGKVWSRTCELTKAPIPVLSKAIGQLPYSTFIARDESSAFIIEPSLQVHMMTDPEYQSNPGRVLFGAGTVSKLPSELQRLNSSSPLLLSGPPQTNLKQALEQILSSASPSIRPAGSFTQATLQTPHHIILKVISYVQTISPDSIISIGGGSTIDLGKTISLHTGLKHICIPTTYSSSENTWTIAETKAGLKDITCHPGILPETVIYDVDLTMTLPAPLAATSGVTAIAQAIEALYAKHSNPIIDLLALEGIRELVDSLPNIVADPQDKSARQAAQHGVWYSRAYLASMTMMSLHHKLCDILGGSFDLPNAETHAIVLPHALAYNAPAVPDALAKLASVLPGSEGDAVTGLNLLLEKLKVKRALKYYGMQEEDVHRAAEMAVANSGSNPRPVELGSVRELLRRCWAGEEARADL